MWLLKHDINIVYMYTDLSNQYHNALVLLKQNELFLCKVNVNTYD